MTEETTSLEELAGVINRGTYMTPLRGAIWGGAVGLLAIVLLEKGLLGPLELPLILLLFVTGMWGNGLFGVSLIGGVSRPAEYFSYVAFVAVFTLAGSILALGWTELSSGRPSSRPQR